MSPLGKRGIGAEAKLGLRRCLGVVGLGRSRESCDGAKPDTSGRWRWICPPVGHERGGRADHAGSQKEIWRGPPFLVAADGLVAYQGPSDREKGQPYLLAGRG